MLIPIWDFEYRDFRRMQNVIWTQVGSTKELMPNCSNAKRDPAQAGKRSRKKWIRLL